MDVDAVVALVCVLSFSRGNGRRGISRILSIETAVSTRSAMTYRHSELLEESTAGPLEYSWLKIIDHNHTRCSPFQGVIANALSSQPPPPLQSALVLPPFLDLLIPAPYGPGADGDFSHMLIKKLHQRFLNPPYPFLQVFLRGLIPCNSPNPSSSGFGSRNFPLKCSTDWNHFSPSRSVLPTLGALRFTRRNTRSVSRQVLRTRGILRRCGFFVFVVFVAVAAESTEVTVTTISPTVASRDLLGLHAGCSFRLRVPALLRAGFSALSGIPPLLGLMRGLEPTAIAEAFQNTPLLLLYASPRLSTKYITCRVLCRRIARATAGPFSIVSHPALAAASPYRRLLLVDDGRGRALCCAAAGGPLLLGPVPLVDGYIFYSLTESLSSLASGRVKPIPTSVCSS